MIVCPGTHHADCWSVIDGLARAEGAAGGGLVDARGHTAERHSCRRRSNREAATRL